MDFKPGDKIVVQIGNYFLETTIDEHGVQRLPNNTDYRELIDKGIIDLNTLARDHINGKVKFEDFLAFYLYIGYSVCGFAELHQFEHLEIKNPLWE